ncbi:DNA replication and repair protein RadA [Balneicella halophila]|uniref:DNA repair protein RadA n=1 Tax=Balneicella halophila TaxID=1537566 RepID=A0A7L4UST8_BALHA|nr:DNA repair protein RadA [Balneicella halophila]PVX52084.1 DNA replication and repair protein RadA [Balneicella halophila]
MAKKKTVFFCTNCGNESPKWEGRCPACGEWNSFKEHTVAPTKTKGRIENNQIQNKAVPLSQTPSETTERIDMKSQELNRVLGGGLVIGSLVLLGGEPGIGKSTLALQVALQLEELKILYVSGEESLQQLALRANRLKHKNDNCLVLAETCIENIIPQVSDTNAELVVIDSIQTLFSETIDAVQGSVTQVRTCASMLMQLAKAKNIPILIIGHVTKDGYIAGPKTLEHMVDTVLQFEGDRHNEFRILRATKNRFGSTSELGIYEMRQEGLREILNPSEILLSQSQEELSGSSVTASMEGDRALLVEIQALVSSAAYGTPQRTSTGFDTRRLNMLLAVLEKRMQFKTLTKDVFINIAGGLKVYDPAIDLSVIISILSSSVDIPVSKSYCFCGEVGLSGEIRPVSKIEQRIKEAEKLGFTKIFIPQGNKKNIKTSTKIEIIGVGKIQQLAKLVFD